MSTVKKKTGLELLREPFLPNQISKLPKPTKKQTDEVRADFKKGIRCEVCRGWHHPDVIHLDYVGHAALTDRLLDCDPNWNWEPLAVNGNGTPVLDQIGGMWIKLTVCDVTRLGYGDADGKTGGNAIKEVIGDAMRNAAMRFGAALDLWHKGELHAIEADEGSAATVKSPPKAAQPVTPVAGAAHTSASKNTPTISLPAMPAGREHLADFTDGKLRLIKQDDDLSGTDLADLIVWYLPQVVEIAALIEICTSNAEALTGTKSTEGMDPIDQGSYDWIVTKLQDIKDEPDLNKVWAKISGVVNGLKNTSPMLYSGIVRGFKQMKTEIKNGV